MGTADRGRGNRIRFRRRRGRHDRDRVELPAPPHERDPGPRLSVLRRPRGGLSMTLPELNLDDRTFNDLVREARLKVMDACELTGWTEHNVSDPGITLIELFAWMTEMTIYRLNRLPEKVHLALLDLLGLGLDPPEAARADIQFRLKREATEPVGVPAFDTEVATPRTRDADPVIFQIQETFTIQALKPVAYLV